MFDLHLSSLSDFLSVGSIPLSPTKFSSHPTLAYTTSLGSASLTLWHQRLAHTSLPIVRKALVNSNNVFSDNKEPTILCLTYQVSKIHKLIYACRSQYVYVPLHVVHYVV